MDHNLLLVFNRNKWELMEDIREMLTECLSNGENSVYIDNETNKEQAESRLRAENKNYDVMITDIHIPARGKSLSIAEDRLGLRLVKDACKNGFGVPSVLVGHTKDEYVLGAIEDLENCKLLTLGENFEENLARHCRNLLPEKSTHLNLVKKKDPNTACVDIHMDLDSSKWNYFLEGTGEKDYFSEGVLEIDQSKFMDLVDRSQNLNDIGPWENELRKIGRDLFEQIFINNYHFSKHYYKMTANVEDQNIKFRLVVKKNIHPVVLEAFIEEDDDTYWMLKSPIYRRLSVSGRFHQFFFNPGEQKHECNCLIIESDFSGPVPELDRNFVKLNNISEEVANLKEVLEKYRRHLRIGKIEIIDSAPENISFAEHVQNVLDSDAWHLVHYAGHSYYDSNTGMGFIIFPGDQYAELKDTKEFSQWLRTAQTQLVVLSSCHSSEEDFVFELAKKEVPAIVGFRWDLDDALVVKYTEKFYNHFFEGKNPLEYAFLEARKDMYKYHSDNRIWAAPILIMQMAA